MLEQRSALDDIYHRRITKTKGGGGFGFLGPTKDSDKGGFVILRTAKIKTLGNMAGSLQHTFRERETPNADEARCTQNQVVVGPDNSEAVLEAWRTNAPEKVRKNAVVGIEYLITGSPAAMARMERSEQDAYFAESINWLKSRHGAENILSAVIHRDETTPHLTAMVIPKDASGKLNARQFLGGRQKLREMQSDFAERVGKSHGLIRGIQGSKAKHQRVKSYYAALERPIDETLKLPKRLKGGLLGRGGETEEEYHRRASASLRDTLQRLGDRSKALAHEMHRQAVRDVDIMRSLKAERDIARQNASDFKEMGSSLYMVETLLSDFEREPESADHETLATIAHAVDQLKVKPSDQILADISQRLAGLGYPPKDTRDVTQDRQKSKDQAIGSGVQDRPSRSR